MLGLAYFMAITVLVAPPLWRRTDLDRIRVAAATTGALAVIYLVYIELFQVQAICLWCTGVHLCTVVLFGLVLTRSAFAPASVSAA